VHSPERQGARLVVFRDSIRIMVGGVDQCAEATVPVIPQVKLLIALDTPVDIGLDMFAPPVRAGVDPLLLRLQDELRAEDCSCFALLAGQPWEPVEGTIVGDLRRAALSHHAGGYPFAAQHAERFGRA